MAKMQKKILFHSADLITVYKRQRVVLEGIERIVFCNSEKMIFEKRGQVAVEGKGLKLEELGNDNVAVTGKIGKIAFGLEEG